MTSQAMVSVVIPTYNRVQLVGDAVASALAQTWGNIEVIVVDDGSSDGTLETLELGYPEDIASGRLQLVGGGHRGASAARNLGVNRARGSHIAFLDSDDLFRPDKVARCMDLFQAEPDRVLVHTWWLQHDLNTGAKIEVESEASGDARAKLLRFARIATPTVMVRTSTFLQAGGFRKDMFLVEDYDTWVRISSFGPLGLVPEALSEVRLHGGNSTRCSETIRRNQRAMINNYFDGYDTTGLGSRAHYLAHADFLMTAEYVDQGRYLFALRSGGQALLQGLRADPRKFLGLLGSLFVRALYRTPFGKVLGWAGGLRFKAATVYRRGRQYIGRKLPKSVRDRLTRRRQSRP